MVMCLAISWASCGSITTPALVFPSRNICLSSPINLDRSESLALPVPACGLCLVLWSANDWLRPGGLFAGPARPEPLAKSYWRCTQPRQARRLEQIRIQAFLRQRRHPPESAREVAAPRPSIDVPRRCSTTAEDPPSRRADLPSGDLGSSMLALPSPRTHRVGYGEMLFCGSVSLQSLICHYRRLDRISRDFLQVCKGLLGFLQH